MPRLEVPPVAAGSVHSKKEKTHLPLPDNGKKKEVMHTRFRCYSASAPPPEHLGVLSPSASRLPLPPAMLTPVAAPVNAISPAQLAHTPVNEPPLDRSSCRRASCPVRAPPTKGAARRDLYAQLPPLPVSGRSRSSACLSSGASLAHLPRMLFAFSLSGAPAPPLLSASASERPGAASAAQSQRAHKAQVRKRS